MVATVGSISVDLSTNAAKFSDGFKRAATTVDQQSGRMAKAVDGVAKATRTASGVVAGFVGGLAAGAVTAGLGALTNSFAKAKEAIAELDQIATRSKAAGITTDSYQALAFAAKQANVEQDTFNKSLEIFAKNVGQAEQGFGGLYNGLAKLNPELLRNIINADDQRERLGLVADALRNAKDATEKAALATAIFGKSGVALIPVLEGGAASLDRMEQNAKDLGIVFDRDLIENASKLDDQLDTLSTVLDVQLKSALLNLGPVLTGAAGLMAEFAKEVNTVTKAVNDFAENPSLDSFDKLRQKLLSIQIEPGSIADNLRQAFAGGTEDIRKNLAAVLSDIEILQAKIAEDKRLNVDTTDAELYLKRLQNQADELRAQLTTEMKINLDTSEAKARLADLAQQFRASEIASMKLLDQLRGTTSGTLPRVTGSNLGRQSGGGNTTNTLTPTGNTITTTKFGQDDKAIIKDISDSIDDGTQSDAQGLDEVSGAVDNSATATRTVGDLLDEALNTGFGNLRETVRTGSQAIQEAVQKGFYLNYENLESAIRTGIVNGIDDSLLGKQYTSVRGSSLIDQSMITTKNADGTTTSTLSGLEQMRQLFTKGTVKAGKFAEGGSFTVPGGSPSGDKNLVTLFANSGETVTVSKPGQSGNVVNLYYQAAAGESPQTAKQNARAMLEFMQTELSRS